MKALLFSAGCAVVCLFSSFVTPVPCHAGTIPYFDGIMVQVTTDTLPRHSAGARSRTTTQGTSNKESQSSDTRGEGTKKGTKITTKRSMDTTNNGAMNTPDTTRAQF